MHRATNPEILDDPSVPAPLAARAHRDLDRVHNFLGNTRAILKALRRDPIKSVLDIGCGHGGVLLEIQRQLNLEVIGVDLRPPPSPPVPILQLDALRDPLPKADVAISVCVAHHFSEQELVQLIQNVRRSSPRFVILDLVRSALPLVLFRTFVAPFLSPLAASDGRLSIRRAYTPEELKRIVQSTKPAGVRHSVALFNIRQIVDISF